MIGFLIGFATRMMWLGFAVVEAFIFKVAWNLWIPYFNDLNLITYKIPEFHLSFLGAFGLFVIVYYVGKFIQMLMPSIIHQKTDIELDKTE